MGLIPQCVQPIFPSHFTDNPFLLFSVMAPQNQLTLSFKDWQVVCELQKDTMNAKLEPMGKSLLHIHHLIE